jgi:FKBP-type peptidyl-prolyl cis-trans isomerase FkpA
MKNLRAFLKVSVFILFIVVTVISCTKDNPAETNTIYTPEREATMMKVWLDSVTARKLNIDTTTTGILYIPYKLGTGAKVKAGDAVTVKYTGRFLDGTIFDTSAYQNEAGTMPYVHKVNRMIIGWEEGIEVLNKGASAVFLIPSAKAYGSKGSSSIPPYTPLIFSIEVVDIK